MTEVETQVAVIGAGPGGYAAAFMAADLGMQVTLIDPEPNPGGVCLYSGCIPTKSLLHAAHRILEAREAGEQGVYFGRPEIDIERLRSWKDEVVAGLTGGLGQLARQRDVRYLRGTAVFEDGRRLRVVSGEVEDETTVAFDKAVIAVGSRARGLPLEIPDSDRLMDAAGALEVRNVPGTLLVIGGGYIGLEVGTVYAALGTRVTVVELTGGLLPGVDRDLVRILNKRVGGLFDELLLETTVKEIREQKNGLRVILEGPDGSRNTRIFEAALVAVGRRPRTEGLGLEKAGVELDDQGFVRVDRQLRTSAGNIFAVGDAVGEPMLAHKATHEGRVAAEVIAGGKSVFEPAAIPAVIFTDPAIAWAGLTETEAKGKKIDVVVSRFPWAASGRAATMGRGEGLTKLLIDPGSERILGAGIVGADAGELIAEAVLAIEMGANAMDLGLSIHPHPTLSETLMEAAEAFHGTATSYYRPKKKRR